MLPERVRLVVLFGGRSAEHEVSCTSAANVVRALDPGRYAVELVGIDQSGRWHRSEAAQSMLSGGPGAIPAALPVDGPDVDREAVLRSDRSPEDAAAPTVVFPVLHGPNGEDGTVQGFLELLDLPYVGSGVLGSALCMDKAAAKTVLGAHDIPQGRWLQVDRGILHDEARRVDLLSRLGQTVFVKPANLGSSVGISRRSGIEDLLAGLQVAFDYDDVVVVEEALSVRELETAVLGAPDGLRVSLVGEVVTGGAFYDYEEKYLKGDARTVVPADIADDVAEAARSLAIRAAWALRVDGMARVDLFLTDDGRLLVNEVNTIPGFTDISMYPMLWAASGVPYPELLDELVRLALERHARRAQLQRSRTDGAQ